MMRSGVPRRVTAAIPGPRASAFTAAMACGILTLSAAAAPSADLNADSRVDQADLLLLTQAWGACLQPCAADLNDDGAVNEVDLAVLLESMAGLDAEAADLPPGPGNQRHDVPAVEAFPVVLEMAAPAAPPPAPASLDRQAAFVAGVNIHNLGPVAPARIQQADAERELKYGHIEPGPKRVGFVREFEPALSIAAGDAKFDQLDDGRGLWTMQIRSPGAYHLRAHLEHIDLGRSTMIVYGLRADDTAVVKGPYTGRGPEGDGDYWTASVPGDTMRVEIVGPDEPQLTITQIVHFDDPMNVPIHPVNDEGGPAGQPGGASLGCHLDVMCQSAVNDTARRATGQMNYVSLFNSYVCTGTLLNDQDSETVVPYFITAYHCLFFQQEVDSLQVVWFWEKDACNGTLPDYSSLPSSNGGTLLVTNDTDDGNDMTFIRLNSVPGGVALAGWTLNSLNSGHGVHHPGGGWKRATWFDDGSGICLDPNDYDYYEITSGAIEGGSSGSGIFNASGQLSGQLYGFCNQTADPPCSEQIDSTCMYGEFESSWEDTGVSFWLSLGGTIWVWWNASPPGFGTQAFPFVTVTQGINFAWNGSQVKILAGSYDETFTVSKNVTLRAINGTVTIGQ